MQDEVDRHWASKRKRHVALADIVSEQEHTEGEEKRCHRKDLEEVHDGHLANKAELGAELKKKLDAERAEGPVSGQGRAGPEAWDQALQHAGRAWVAKKAPAFHPGKRGWAFFGVRSWRDAGGLSQHIQKSPKFSWIFHVSCSHEVQKIPEHMKL